jgi:hypothetical protein
MSNGEPHEANNTVQQIGLGTSKHSELDKSDASQHLVCVNNQEEHSLIEMEAEENVYSSMK